MFNIRYIVNDRKMKYKGCDEYDFIDDYVIYKSYDCSSLSSLSRS